MSVGQPAGRGWQGMAFGLGTAAVFLLGLGLVGLGFARQSTVDQFQAAAACSSSATAASECYQLVPATITNDDHQYHKAQTHDYLTLRFETSSQTVDVLNGDPSLLQLGTKAEAKIYQGLITDVVIRGEDMQTDNNPAQREGNTLAWGLVLTVVTGLMLWTMVVVRRNRRAR